MSGYFYGWYFRCQSDTQTLAVIPTVHGAGRERTCSIQIITDDGAWTAAFRGALFQQKKDSIVIDKNRFSKDGICLNINTRDLKVGGKIKFSALTPLKYDIMGPFALVPFMECRHSVYSMGHRIDGRLCLNGKEYVFENALGYWEGDSGKSFPRAYAWTQCFVCDRAIMVEQMACMTQPIDSVMLAVADIPLAEFHFTGIIGVVFWKGKEYRFATYLGARVVDKSNQSLLIRQGTMELEVRLLEKRPLPLQAPTHGTMARTIYESATCRAFYRFRIQGVTLFSSETDKAAFEYEY